MNLFKVNRLFAMLMVVLLLGSGLIGQRIRLSRSNAYDLFHIVFGILALVAVVVQGGKYAAVFNLVFGAIDLYQGVAYNLGLFPSQLFALMPFDTVVHYGLGAALFIVGLQQLRRAPFGTPA